MDKTNSIKKGILITSALSLVAIGAVAYFVIIPQIDNIRNTKQKIEKQRLDLEKRYIQGQNLKKLTENIEKVEKRMPALEKIYIEQEEALEFVTSLENIAEKNFVEQKIELIPAKNDNTVRGEYQESPLQISATGRYLNVLSYLSDLESMEYYVKVNNTDITNMPVRKESSERSVNIKIQASIYWKNEN